MSDQILVCVTPTLSDSKNIPDTGRRVNISLVLERSFTKTLEYTAFNIYPNPLINVGDTDTVLSAGDSLVIKVSAEVAVCWLNMSPVHL